MAPEDDKRGSGESAKRSNFCQGRKRWFVLLASIMGLLSVIYLLTFTPFIWPFAGDHPLIWLAFGLMTNVGALAYAIVPQQFHISFSGRANSALNFVVFAFAFAAQYTVGAIIDLWPRTASGGYAPEGYQAAFGATAAAVVLTLLWFWVPLKKRP